MLAYMKMAKSDDDGPWFAPPTRLHRSEQKRNTKSQFFNETSIETPETSSEQLDDDDDDDDDDDGPLCLVVSKTDDCFMSPMSNTKQFLPTPPGSPRSSDEGAESLLAVSINHFRDPMLAPVDLMEKIERRKEADSGRTKGREIFRAQERNNLAAKKSRDARKSREDHIAVRANALEKENAVLRAQLVTLREEAESLQLLLALKKSKKPIKTVKTRDE
uniref:BZIP domain-containing protein n=1 Tax=Strigamia maritima TaxID=126957 RepID=T1IZE2_STRMM